MYGISFVFATDAIDLCSSIDKNDDFFFYLTKEASKHSSYERLTPKNLSSYFVFFSALLDKNILELCVDKIESLYVFNIQFECEIICFKRQHNDC